MPRPIKKHIPWLDVHDNGTYYMHWYDPKTRQSRKRSLRTKDPEQAQKEFAEHLIGRRYETRESPQGPTVKEVLGRYLEEHRCASIERQRFAAARLVGFFESKRVSEIDVFLSREYTAWRTTGERPAANATVRRELNTLVAAANHDIKFHKSQPWRLRPHQAPSVELPVAEKKKIQVFTQAEVAALIKAAGKDVYMQSFLILLYFTAARREAIRELRVSQIDIGNRVIHLLHEGATATSKRKATVPILEPMVGHLTALMAMSEDGRLFPEVFDAYRRFKTLCKRLGLEGHPHVFRHSRATHLLQSGKSIYHVAKLLGDSVATVERTYGHTSSEFERSATTPGDASII